jgi:peptidyl-prolyl cis-trans isomerase C
VRHAARRSRHPLPMSKERPVTLPSTHRLLLAPVAAALALALGACTPKQDAAASAAGDKSPAVATVNGVPITALRVDGFIKQGLAQGRPDTPEARKAIIDGLAMQMVAAEAALQKGLDKTPDVQDQLDGVRQSVLANAYVQDFLKTNPVTDEALKAEYDRIKASVSGTEYKARHILVANEAEARDIIAKLKKDPGAFAKIAADKSKDPGSKTRGGDLGWFDAQQMVPEFGAALGKLEKGQITTEPVKTQFGYHVIALDDTRPIEPPPFEAVKAQLSQQVQQQAMKKQLDDLKAKAKIEIVGAAAAASAASAPATAPGASAATK